METASSEQRVNLHEMAERRKLLAEMDKVFRKVDEGVELFDDIMVKMQEANSDNQREKFQDDLKKEIKKLQRLRDQIKGWQNSNDIKDKEKLIGFRKVIEGKMEQFKEIERENKTKPHSKQGLCAEEKMDPREQEKSGTIQWLQLTIERLSRQCDIFEAEVESIGTGSTKKSKKVDKDKVRRSDEVKERLEKHKFHIQKLELVLRLVNNESLDCYEVREALEDHLNMYLCEDDDGDGDESNDYEWIYDDLDLGDLAEITQQLGNVTNIGTLEEADIVSEPNSPIGSLSGSPTPPKEGSKEAEEIIPKQRHASGDPELSRPLAVRSHSMSAASRSTPNTPLKSQNSGEGSLPSPPPSAVTPPISAASIPYAAAARPASVTKQSSTTSSSSSKQPTPGPVELRAPTPVTSVSLEHTMAYQSLSDSAMVQAVNAIQQLSISSSPVPLMSAMATVSQPSPQHISIPSPTRQLQLQPLVLPSMSASIESTASSDQISQIMQPTQQMAPTLLMNGPDRIQSDEMNVLSLRAIAEQAISPSSSLSVNMPVGLPSSVAGMSFGVLGSQPQTQPQDAHIPPSLGASPLGPAPAQPEHQAHLLLLDAAIQRMPMSADSERPRHYLPRSSCQTPNYYPQIPPPMFDTLEYFSRLQPETLFFVFYYMEGTKAQYFAARALKKQSWRFHKKYMMWFQRHEEPKAITDDYEQGTYVYFDYEKWAQRKKEGFTFEYRYLEDRELV